MIVAFMDSGLWWQRAVSLIALMVAVLVIPSGAAANTTIVVCNRGDAELLVASYKVYDTYDPIDAWSRIQPSECRAVHSDMVRDSLIHINEGARVNLAFLPPNGVARSTV
jgi:uncharacterized membrane protein